MGEKKLHTREFQLNGTGGNMRCKLLQKRSAGKTTVFKHFQALIFTLKLCDLPPPLPQQYNPSSTTTTKIKISDPPPLPRKDFSKILLPTSPPPHKLEGGGACHALHMYLLILALESYIFSGRNKYVNIMLRNILSCIKSLNFDLVVKLGAVISFPLVFS